MRTRRTISSGWVCAAALCTVSVTGCAFALPGPEPAPLGPPPAVAGSDAFAPYVDVSLGRPPEIAPVLWDNDIKRVNLGFITDGGHCTPQWNGLNTLHDQSADGRLASMRAVGVDTGVSFGGSDGHELAAGCADPGTLAAAYQQVIDDYRLTRVDFDLESAALTDQTAVDRRNQAVKTLQDNARRAGRRLEVSYTLPANPRGLGQPGEQVVRRAVAAGVELTAVNLLAMDYGEGVTGNLGDRIIASANGVRALLGSMWPTASDDELWHRIAITPMLGRNDDPAETFGQDDARLLVAFAMRHHLAWLSFWSLTRDQPCAAQADAETCSGIDQQPYEFTRILHTYRG
ncbi:hypothetical protein HFP15_24325 [Amycolatopsis sp. K13G38]|uniref:Chitinase n=1 Tax=Amycolatopsis acididurans TaxID=2724524 RepID=A0ABX1J885_9PSEU|nr:chitinase [Amycolatopsis acididurans]NKQ56010.1 hypothetical protein [Amycolatopsis acididurans]